MNDGPEGQPIEIIDPLPNFHRQEQISLLQEELNNTDDGETRVLLEQKLKEVKNPQLKDQTMQDTGTRRRAYGENLQGAWDLPPHLWWVGYFSSQNLEQLKQSEGNIYYHGTRSSSLKLIREVGGLKAFAEKTTAKLAVFGTPDATLAAYHAYYRGGKDTYSGDFSENKIDQEDPVVLLEIDLREIPGISEEHRTKLREKALIIYREMENWGNGSFYAEPIYSFIPEGAIKIVAPASGKNIGEVVKLPLK